MDVKQLIESSGRTFKEIAEYLFVGIKHPERALTRIASGNGEFSESQLKQLCALCFITIPEYYSGVISKKHKTLIRTENATGVYHSKSKTLNVYKNNEAMGFDIQVVEDTKLSHVIEVINSF